MKFNIIRILLITCLLSSQVGIWAQTKSITGTVCDTNGEMIIGANVTVKGTTKGTITNVYGIYTVSATPKDIIEISFIGYKSVQIVKCWMTWWLSVMVRRSGQTLPEQ